MIFRNVKRLSACLLCFLILFSGVVSTVAAPAKVGMVTQSSSSEKVTVMLSFPVMAWDGAFELTLEYDPTVLKYSSSGCNISEITAEGSNGAMVLKSGVDHTGGNWEEGAVRVNVVFNVLLYKPEGVTVTCTPKDIYDKNGELAVSGASSLSVTLKEPTGPTTPPVSEPVSTAPTTDTDIDSSVPTDIPSDSETDPILPETDTHTDDISVTESDVVSDTETLTDTADTITTDSSTDLTTDASTDSQDFDRVIPVPPAMERNAIFLLVGAAVLVAVFVVVALMRRR